MTENFGPVGIGWTFTIDKMWTEAGTDGQVFAFVNISMRIKVNSEWSESFPGTGGHQLVVKEKYGLHNNDEAFKMATTDALSVAMKMIGVAADVYSGMQDSAFPDSKYGYQAQEHPEQSQAYQLEQKARDLFDQYKNCMTPEQANYCMDNVKQFPQTVIDYVEKIKASINGGKK